MSGNKAAYETAYQRALAGKSQRSAWAFLTTYFEDEYTRQSRERGERDGTAAREAAKASAEMPASPAS